MSTLTLPLIREKLLYYAQLVRLDKPIGIYLLLWPTLWALWFSANGIPDTGILIIFVLGVVFMRSAGCAINDIADRKIDPHVERTKNRPLAAGVISTQEALVVFAVLIFVSLLLVLQLNWLTVAMSVIAALLAASYPFMKRYHHYPQVYLGAAFGWAIPMAYTAITGVMPPLSGWLLFVATMIWTAANDTMYGITDREYDLKIGVKSTAILFGRYDRLIIFILQVITYLLLIAVGVLEGMGWLYYAGLLVSTGFVAYQQSLLAKGDATLGVVAFLNNNWLGMVVFIGVALDYIF